MLNCWLIGLALAFEGAAQQIRWDAPVFLRVEPESSGARAVLRFESADGGDLPHERSPIDDLFVRRAGEQENFSSADAGTAILTINTPARDALMVGVEFRTVRKTFIVKELHQLAAPPAAALLADVQRGRETLDVTLAASGTTLLRPVGFDGPFEVAMSKTGQRAELRPLLDPTAIRPPGDLPLVVYADTIRRPGVRLVAHSPTHAERSYTTDAAGIAHVRIDRPGRWRIGFSLLDYSDDPFGGAWTLFTGSLSFDAAAMGDSR